MFRKKNRSKKRSRAMLSAYSIIMILIILLGIMSHVLPKAKYSVMTPDSEPTVEVGPGEWEGEVPPEKPEALQLPDGESVTPEVGDNAPETRMLTGEEVPEDEMSNRSVENEAYAGENAVVYNKGFDDEHVVIESEEEATEVEKFDTREECEEVYGEGQCEVVEGLWCGRRNFSGEL